MVSWSTIQESISLCLERSLLPVAEVLADEAPPVPAASAPMASSKRLSWAFLRRRRRQISSCNGGNRDPCDPAAAALALFATPVAVGK